MRIVFLLGAGFSIPYIKVGTPELTRSLLCKSMWENIICDFKDLNSQSNNYTFNVEFLSTILHEIESLLTRQHYTYCNFEYIIHVLDRLGAYFHDEDLVGHIDNIALHILCEGRLKKVIENAEKDLLARTTLRENIFYIPEPKRKAWFVIPYLARELIVRALLYAWYGFCLKELEELDNIRNFFKYLIDRGCQIQIYTLNYDPIIWETLKEFRDFVSTGFLPNNFVFNPLQFFEEKPISLAFLHGFVGFVPQNRLCYIDENWNDAQKKRLTLASQVVGFCDDSVKLIHYNTFLITGLDKTEIFIRQPFCSYYNKFALDIFRADLLVIIGYRGLDVHINMIIKNFLMSGNERKVILVTYRKDCEMKRFIDAAFGVSYEVYNEFQNLLGKVFDNRLQWQYIWIYNKGAQEFVVSDNSELLVRDNLLPGEHCGNFLNVGKLYQDL